MLEFSKDKNKCVFKVKKEIYPLNIIYQTAYLFIDDFYIGLDEDEKEYLIYLTPKTEMEISSKHMVGNFQNELLNQCLKKAVRNDTKTIRELIVTRALYSSFLHEEEMEEEEKEEDTDYNLEDIAKAWYDEEQI